MSPSTEPDTAVATGSASSAPAGLVSGHLDTGTTPVFSMSGPQGPPTVYVPTNPDPLQGSGDPWLSFNTGMDGRSDGSFLSSGTYQTGQSTGQSAAHQGHRAHQQLELRLQCRQVFWTHQVVQQEVQRSSCRSSCEPRSTDDASTSTANVADPTMVDFLSRTAQGAGAVPPLPGAQGPVPQAQVQGSQGQGSDVLPWIPSDSRQHPCQTGSLGVQGQKSCLVSRVG